MSKLGRSRGGGAGRAGPLGLLATATLALLAPSAPARADDAACKELAEVFYVVAKYRERGDTRTKQLEWLDERLGRKRSDEQRAAFRRIVDFIYESDASPGLIRDRVRARCRVDDDGRLVLSSSP